MLINVSKLMCFYSLLVAVVRRHVSEVFSFQLTSSIFFYLTKEWLEKGRNSLQFRISVVILVLQCSWFLYLFDKANFKLNSQYPAEVLLLKGCVPISLIFFIIVLGAQRLMRSNSAVIQESLDILKKEN